MAIELRPRFLWLDHQLAEGYAVRIGSDGRIRHVAPTNQPPQHDLEDAAIFPGFVNAHSHAFQWGLRGWVQRSSGVGGFFSWRDRMYELVEQLDAHQIYRESRLAYKAMRRAGYTSVGEFHYVHHQPDARPYPNDIELAEAVVQAARDENIRLRLLHAAYFRNSGSEPDASPAQLRFCDSSAEAFLARHKRLGKRLEAMGDPRVGLGTALHSTRAVPLAEMATIARATYGPLHVHINEQPREIDDAIQEYELRPFDVLEQAGALGRRTTLVHMTHATVSELERTAAHQAQICFCPTTERDLGDGIGPSRAGLARGIYMSIGSDSHAQIDPLAECRLLEAHERLRFQQRNVVGRDIYPTLAARLRSIGSTGGARSLNIRTGEIAPGYWGDLIAVDLTDPDFVDCEPEIIPDVMVFSASIRAITRTWVGGVETAVGDGFSA